MPDAGWEPECEGGEGRFYVREEGQDMEAHMREGPTGARMLPRMRRRPWTWASWCESCSIEDGWEEVSVGLCD